MRSRLRRLRPGVVARANAAARVCSLRGLLNGAVLRAGLAFVLLWSISLLINAPLHAASTAPSEVVLVLSDAMARSSMPAHVDGIALTISRGKSRGLGGERLALLVDEAEVATATSGPDGRVTFTFETRRLGLHPMRVVRAGDQAASQGPAVEGRATLAVWEKRKPLLLIEQAVLPETAESKSAGGASTASGEPAPQPAAVDALARLGHFFYNLVYLLPQRDDQPRQLEAYRAWLVAHHLPPGIVVTVPAGGEGLTALIERLKAEGWENVRAGVGRTPAFAQALVGQRIRTVIQGAPAGAQETGDYPRKARLASDWLTVRKHLQD